MSQFQRQISLSYHIPVAFGVEGLAAALEEAAGAGRSTISKWPSSVVDSTPFFLAGISNGEERNGALVQI
jgi:hypothetical protein